MMVADSAGVASTAFFELLVREINTDIAVFDRELRYEYVNPSAVRDPAVREWIIGKTDVEYVAFRGMDPGLAERRQATLRGVLASGHSAEFEEMLTTAGGDERH